MANLVSIPFQFSPNTLIQSSQVNADFQALALFINNGIGSSGANGYTVLPGGIYLQWQTITGVAADGSLASAVSFPTPFPTACFGVTLAILNAYQSNPWEMTLQWDTPTTSGCNVNVAGAPNTSTVSVFAISIGN